MHLYSLVSDQETEAYIDHFWNLPPESLDRFADLRNWIRKSTRVNQQSFYWENNFKDT